jgi:hypothetical protein
VPWPAAPWACIAGLNLIKNACRPDPHVVEHLPTSTPAAGPAQLKPLQVIGGELDPSEIVRDGPRAGCGSCHGLGGCSWSSPLGRHAQRRDDDPLPTTGRTSRWAEVERDRSVVCFVTETSPDDLGVSGSMGRCPPDYGPAAGTGHHPTRMISRRPRPGRISPSKAVVSLTQGDRR